MKKGRKYFQKIIIIAMVIFTILLLAEFVALFFLPPQPPQMSAYTSDPKWNDLTLCYNSLKETPGYRVSNTLFTPGALASLTDVRNTVFLIIGPEREYSASEVSAISDFVRRGGSIVVADDSVKSNVITDKAGANSLLKDSSTYHGDPLLSLDCDKNPILLKADARLGDREYELLFNEPTALLEDTYGSSGLVKEKIASSSRNTWLDVNENEEFDPGEPDREIMKEYSLITLICFSETGYGLFISDSSLFINDMWARADNSRFIMDAIYTLIGGNGTVIIDESVHKESSIIGNAITFTSGAIGYLLNSLIFNVILAVVLIAAIIVMIVRAKKIQRKPHRIQRRTPILLELKNPDIDFSELHRLRTLIFDLLCIEYDLDYRFFWEHPEELEDLIRDYTINRFMVRPDIYEEGYMAMILGSCESRWTDAGELVRSGHRGDAAIAALSGGIAATGPHVVPVEVIPEEPDVLDGYEETDIYEPLEVTPLEDEAYYNLDENDDEYDYESVQERYDEPPEEDAGDHSRSNAGKSRDIFPIMPNLVEELFPSRGSLGNKKKER